jgi:hypothetical protein
MHFDATRKHEIIHIILRLDSIFALRRHRTLCRQQINHKYQRQIRPIINIASKIDSLYVFVSSLKEYYTIAIR